MKIYIENNDVTISATKKSADFSTREVCNMLSMAATQDETVLRPDRTRTFPQPIEPMPGTQFLDRKQTSAVFSPQKRAEPVQDSDEDSMVLAKIKCPQCGNDQDQEVEHFHKFVFCPKCSTKLFLKWTMPERYEKDENGYARIAERVFDEEHVYVPKSHREQNEQFEREDEIPELPEDTPTISSSKEEIEKWLDDHDVAHDGIEEQLMLLRLATQVSMGMQRDSNND